MLPTITTPAPHTAPNTSHHHTHKKNCNFALTQLLFASLIKIHASYSSTTLSPKSRTFKIVILPSKRVNPANLKWCCPRRKRPKSSPFLRDKALTGSKYRSKCKASTSCKS